MDKLVNSKRSRGSSPRRRRPSALSREEAEDAVRTLIRWAGDDPDREGLRGYPGAGGARL